MPRLTEIPPGCAFNPRCPPLRALPGRAAGSLRPAPALPPAGCYDRCASDDSEAPEVDPRPSDGAAVGRSPRSATLFRRVGAVAGAQARGQARQIVQAVDGVDFEIAEGRDLLPGGRNPAAASRPSPALVVGLYRRPRADRCSTASTGSTPQRAAPSAAPAHADDLPGPLCQPQSALAGVRYHRRADPRLRSCRRPAPTRKRVGDCCARSA